LIKPFKRPSVLGLCFDVVFSLLFLMTPSSTLTFKEPFDYFRNSWNVVGLKDYERATRITPDNQLLLAGKDRITIAIGAELEPLSRRQTKTLLEGWLPVVLLSTEKDEVRYDFTVWATPLPTVSDWRAAFNWPTEGENFLTWLSCKTTNLGEDRTQARIRIRQDLAAEDYAKVAEPPAEDKTGSRKRDAVDHDMKWTLLPGESREASVNFCFLPTGDASSFPKEDPKLWLRRTADFWKELIAQGTRISVPCRKATEALLASHVCQLLALDRGEIHAGEGFYDVFYIRDGAYQVMEFEEAGFLDIARRAIDSYLSHQRPDGRFESQQGQFDANGQAVWVLWQHYKITGDIRWLETVYPAMRKAVSWTTSARRMTSADPSFPGLLPAAPADGEYLWDGKHHIVGYDFWNLRAMVCTAAAARALGKKKDAKELEQEIDAYRESIDAACKKTGLTYFPPSWEMEGTPWGNTEILWPVPIFKADEPRIEALSRFVREEYLGGYVEGIIRWGTEAIKKPVIHPYMGAYTTMNDLHRGRDEQVVKDFYSYLLHSTAGHAFPEGIYFRERTAWGETIPHATGASNYALLLRHMLVHEDGDTLHLLPAVPDWWLGEGQEIRAQRLPTHFGEMSLIVRGKPSGVEVDLTPPQRQPPRRIVLHLPKSRRLENEIKAVKTIYRSDQARRWDFETVRSIYEKSAPPLF
jgi:hypothetical protein